VNAAERKRIESKGFKDFVDFSDEKRIMWIRRKQDGSCFFLTKENKCAVYSLRPAICRLEPFTIKDFDYEKNQIELELNFPSACACEGVFEGQKVPYEVIAKAAQMVVQKILLVTSKDLNLPVTDKKVASEARARILRIGVEKADLSVEPENC
jgi:Fe-S-cluster containining protein